MAQLAREVGVSPDTVRYYERRGLLPPPPRTTSGYRRYDTDARDRLWFIRGAQRLGLSLTEITDLLAVRDAGTCPCGPGEDLLRHRLTQLDDEIQQLSSLHRTRRTPQPRTIRRLPRPRPRRLAHRYRTARPRRQPVLTGLQASLAAASPRLHLQEQTARCGPGSND